MSVLRAERGCQRVYGTAKFDSCTGLRVACGPRPSLASVAAWLAPSRAATMRPEFVCAIVVF